MRSVLIDNDREQKLINELVALVNKYSDIHYSQSIDDNNSQVTADLITAFIKVFADILKKWLIDKKYMKVIFMTLVLILDENEEGN